jgi:hypothetical protein
MLCYALPPSFLCIVLIFFVVFVAVVCGSQLLQIQRGAVTEQIRLQ